MGCWLLAILGRAQQYTKRLRTPDQQKKNPLFLPRLCLKITLRQSFFFRIITERDGDRRFSDYRLTLFVYLPFGTLNI